MLQLTERQRMTIAAAITVVAGLILILTVAAVLYLVGAFFNNFSSVFLPVAVAGVLALVLNPFYEWLNARLGWPPALALVAVFLSILLPIVGLGWFFGAIIAGQIGDLIERAPGLWANLSQLIEERWPQVLAFWNEHPWGVRLQTAVVGQQETLVHELGMFSGKALSAGAGVLRGLGGLFTWAVLPVYLAFFLMAKTPDVEGKDLLPFLKPETRKDVIYLGREFVEIVVAFFRGQLLIALMQGLLFALGFSLVGLRYGLILGLLLGFLNIIPYLGSIVGLGVALPLGMFQEGGGLTTVILVIVVFTAVQMIEGYVLTPRIMGEQTGLHPMVIIIAIFFWGSALGGISGMILAIPLTAFLVSFWRLAKEKYIPELV